MKIKSYGDGMGKFDICEGTIKAERNLKDLEKLIFCFWWCKQQVSMVKGRRGRGKAHPDAGEGLVHVNVGGLRHSLSCGTLNKFPDTRLGKLLECRSEEDILQVSDEEMGIFSLLGFAKDAADHRGRTLLFFNINAEFYIRIIQ